jgi:nicotinamidase-related amidase
MVTVTWEPSRTALIVADLQNASIEALGEGAPALLQTARTALDASRAAGVTVIHVRVAFQPGYPEVSQRNKSFRSIAGSNRLVEGSPEAEIHATVAPTTGEPVVTKRRVGAFHATNLDQILRAKDIDHLVLAGYATSGVILTTVRDGADRDYELTVLSDAVADNDKALHAMLLGTVFPRQAEVVTTDAFTGAIS